MKATNYANRQHESSRLDPSNATLNPSIEAKNRVLAVTQQNESRCHAVQRVRENRQDDTYCEYFSFTMLE